MTKLIFLTLLAASSAGAQTPAPLSMDCHLLLAGFPQPDVSTYSVVGRDMFLTSNVGRTRISTAGALLPLGRSIDRGVVSHSWADHTRTGSTVTRRVYAKDGARPRRLAFTERYDFARKTVFTTGESGDSCHADGK